MFPYGDTVTVVRGGVEVGAVTCGWDPAENKLYGPYEADLQQGDVVGLRGFVRRVTGLPELWRNPFTGWLAGMVVQVEAAPPLLPDLGSLSRPAGALGFDRASNSNTPATREVVWTGPCLVVAEAVIGDAGAVTEQIVTGQPFTVTVPLDVVNVRPDDRFTVLQSRDGRLTMRNLTVVVTAAGSHDLVRTFRAVDNQG